MQMFVRPLLCCAATMLFALAIPTTCGQPSRAVGAVQAASAVGAQQPGGLLTKGTGKYLTIEGIKLEGGKVETNTLLVDTVDGKKLEQPVPLVIHVNYIKEHNLREASFRLPSRQRCIFKGYESGSMVGVPPAVYEAAREQGWTNVPMSPVSWHWRPYFVALVLVQPKVLDPPALPSARRQ